jgi:hypothetical protein
MTKNPKQLPAVAGAPASEQLVKVDPKVRTIFQEMQAITEENFYAIDRYSKTKGEDITIMEPDAKALQFFANEQGGISTQIIEAGADDHKAWCRLKGWPTNRPEKAKEEQVTIVFQTEVDRLILNRVRHGCKKHQAGCPFLKEADGQPKYGTNGLPILELPYEMFDVLDQAMRVKTFGERMALTKCEARLHKKLLNVEWREPEEIEHEQSEVATASGKPLPETPKPVAAETPKPEEGKPTKKGPRVHKAEKPAPEPATAPEEKPTGVPKAQIPTEQEMRERAQKEDPKKDEPNKPKTVSERVVEIALRTACSKDHMTAFIKRALKIDDLSKANKENVKALVSLCEVVLVTKKVEPTALGAYIRNDNFNPEAVKEFTGMLAEVLP